MQKFALLIQSYHRRNLQLKKVQNCLLSVSHVLHAQLGLIRFARFTFSCTLGWPTDDTDHARSNRTCNLIQQTLYQTIIFRLRFWTATESEHRVRHRLSGLFHTNAPIFSLLSDLEKLRKARIRIVVRGIPRNDKIQHRKPSTHSKFTIIYTRWVSAYYHIFCPFASVKCVVNGLRNAFTILWCLLSF